MILKISSPEHYTKKFMDKQVAIYVIIVLAFSLGLVNIIIFISIFKQRNLFQQAKKSLNDQQNTLVIKRIKLLDEPSYFYRQKYTYQIIGIDIYTKEELVLYIMERDFHDFIENDEYQIIHDGVVVLEYRKNYF